MYCIGSLRKCCCHNVSWRARPQGQIPAMLLLLLMTNLASNRPGPTPSLFFTAMPDVRSLGGETVSARAVCVRLQKGCIQSDLSFFGDCSHGGGAVDEREGRVR